MSRRSAFTGRTPPELRVGITAEQLRRPVPGGIGTYTRGLLQGLLELPESERPALELLASATRGEDPLSDIGVPLRTSRLPRRLLTRAWSRGWRAGRGDQVVHATSFGVPKVAGSLVVTVHDLLWREFPDAYGAHGRAWHEAELRRAARRAVAFVVPSDVVAERLVGAGVGVGLSAVHVIAEGADHLPPPDDAGTKALLSGFGISGAFFLAVGTVEPRKNLGTLVRAYASVREHLPGRADLVICGPRGWGSELWAEYARPPAGVHLAGPVGLPILAGLYRAAAALVFVPLGEGFGLPVVEAMTAGAPVIASDVPAGSGATLRVDPYDEAAIGAAMVRVLGEPEMRARLIELGRAAVSTLSWREVARAHVALWRSIARYR